MPAAKACCCIELDATPVTAMIVLRGREFCSSYSRILLEDTIPSMMGMEISVAVSLALLGFESRGVRTHEDIVESSCTSFVLLQCGESVGCGFVATTYLAHKSSHNLYLVRYYHPKRGKV